MKKIAQVLISLWVITLMVSLFGHRPEASKNPKIREAVFAGSWYEGTQEGLKKQVHRYLDQVPEDLRVGGKLLGLVSPHAGLQYSGPTAACGYHLLEGSGIKRVVVLAPSHQKYFHGVSIAGVDYYRTPIGDVPVARRICDKLLQKPLFQSVRDAHAGEHSLEIQLPFLQQVLPEFRLIPIVVGRLSGKECAAVAATLMPFIDQNTVVVASSDFTHYGHNFQYVPFTDQIEENLKKLDYGAFDRITEIDPEGFAAYVQKTGATICGHHPIAILLHIGREKNCRGKLLKYETSGEITGDFGHSVSYGALALYQEKVRKDPSTAGGRMDGGKRTGNKSKSDKAPEKNTGDRPLSEEERTSLLKLARETLGHYLAEGKTPSADKKDLSPMLLEPRGAFVTLKINGKLRGCIGYVEARKPLHETIMDNAVNAGTRDPRFTPITADELEKAEIEISVMTPLSRIRDVSEIQPGKHGLMITRGYHSGLLLPQVATEYNWDRDTFLEHTCLKAGLKKNDWKLKDTEIYIFSAQVFHEE